MKKVIFVITALALIAIALLSCTAQGISQEEYDELKHQLDVIEAKFDALEAGLSGIREELEAARTQEPTGEQKLVGQATYAEWETDGIHNYIPGGVIITNPDCVSEITVDRVFVFAYDGTLVYEGPLRVKVDDEWKVYTVPLKPHETLQTSLEYYDLPELTLEVEMVYTVEIFWSWTDKKGLPLTGCVSNLIIRRDASTHELIEIELGGVVQMVNMEQELEPED